MTRTETVAETRARGQRAKQSLPQSMLATASSSHQRTTRRTKPLRRDRDERDRIEAGYDELDGVWRDWLDVARRYEHKLPTQDRMDFRHTLILRLATAHQRTGQPIPTYQAYRIASFCVADYYYQAAKVNRGLDCKHCDTARRRRCSANNLYSECPKIRQVVSVDAEWLDGDGRTHSLLDTLADDNAVDLDQWLDARTWLIGCPVRLVEIAHKLVLGQKLNGADRKYLCKARQQTAKRLF